MNAAPISFKGLDYSNVSTADRDFVKKEFKKLNDLGKIYDIRLTSTYADIPYYAAIDVDVKPLKSSLKFFERLFCPIGRSTFQTFTHQDGSLKPSIVNSVREAIIDLGKKMHK